MHARASLLLLASLLGAPSGAYAQACFGNGAGSGQAYLSTGAAFTEGAWALTGSLGLNSRGPIAFSVDASHTMLNDSDLAATAIGVTLGTEMDGIPLSLCPVIFGAYSWLSNEGEGVAADGWVLGGGLALGKRLENRSGLVFVPTLSSVVVHVRSSVRIGEFSVGEGDTAVSFTGGLLVGKGRLYAGPTVSLSTQGGSDPVFGATVQLVF